MTAPRHCQSKSLLFKGSKAESATNSIPLEPSVVGEKDVVLGKRLNTSKASTSRYLDDFGLHMVYFIIYYVNSQISGCSILDGKAK